MRNATTINNDTHLTETEVARLIGRSISKLQKDRFKRVGIPFVKYQGAVRYSLFDVRTYMRGLCKGGKYEEPSVKDC